MLLFEREPEKEPQLFKAEVRPDQMRSPVARISRLDQGFQDVECRRLDTVAEQELLRFREALDRLHQPVEKLEVGFNGRAGSAGIVGHAANYDGRQCAGARFRTLSPVSTADGRRGARSKKIASASGGMGKYGCPMRPLSQEVKR